MAERNRSSGGGKGKRDRLGEGLRNTEIKRDTDIRNSMGQTEESSQNEAMKKDYSERERTRGRSEEEPE